MSFKARDDLVELFARASAMPPAERDSFLAELGRADPGAAKELEELLSQDRRAGPLPSAASARHSLVDELVEELGREHAPEGASSAVLEKLSARRSSLSRYAIRGELARGGMGAILAVWDEDIGRDLAMKVALGDLRKRPDGTPETVDAHTLARFLEEAQVTGQLDHPGIVPVHELGLDREGRVYFTMRLVRGRDLERIFALVQGGEEGWTQTRALGVLLKVCEAMSYAHASGVVHRDLKPANVMVGSFGEVYVMDWGLARARGRRGARADARGKDGGALPATTGLLATQDGAIMGTPAYMAPEQAAGRAEEVDERSDVYAVGAMLYQLLTGQRPYCAPGQEVAAFALIARVLAGPPASIHSLAPESPAELIAISEKAMARAPDARYQDTGELGEDLRAFLEGRVVRAYETGAWAEARKWVRRNRGFAGALAAGLLALIAGLTASMIQKQRADQNAQLAERRRVLAEENERSARNEREKVMRLSVFRDLEELQREAEQVWPAEPSNADAYRDWLERARRIVAGLEPSADSPGHRRQLAELQARALPWTDEQRALERAGHPRARALEGARARLAAFERATRVRAGELDVEPALAEITLDPRYATLDAYHLGNVVFQLGRNDRTEFGRELEALVIGRLAMEKVDAASHALVAKALSWASLANGLDEEALAYAEEALGVAPASKTRDLQENLALIQEALHLLEDGGAARHLQELRDDVVRLESEVAERQRWEFESAQDAWWHDSLRKLIAEIEALVDPVRGLISGTSPANGWGIERRLQWAEQVAALTYAGLAGERWTEAIASIADGRACPAYDGLELTPQLGLVPLGRDPQSGLWEFYHLQSGDEPARGADGTLRMEPGSAVVLVLIPGSRFLMGAQARDPAAPNYDPSADPREGPVHAVELSPYFLSKYELTQGQWTRLTAANPSYYGPSWSDAIDGRFPVESLTFVECERVLRWMGLTFPTTTQWECAVRAGTTTPLWCGAERRCLARVDNLKDVSAVRGAGASLEHDDWDDGYAFHAPVGTFPPNPFGLHETMGNVAEWCLDHFVSDFYVSSPTRDPVAISTRKEDRIVRGGSFARSSAFASSARYTFLTASTRSFDIGVRPARALTRP